MLAVCSGYNALTAAHSHHAMITREILSSGWRVRLDLATQFLRLEVPEMSWDFGGGDGKLSPTPPGLSREPVSAATLLVKTKQFDDGLLAAVELAAQTGSGCFRGKASLLQTLVAAGLTGPAAVTVFAAARLGGVPVEVPDSIAEVVERVAQEFLTDEIRSKPLGFYLWSPELTAVFRQDRFLQQPLDPPTADVLAEAIRRLDGGSQAYAAVLRLAARLAAPLANPDLSAEGIERAFLPASRSFESVLVERLYGHLPIPEDFELMGELIRRIRSGEVDLTPREESGWYDYQPWSLETLIAPQRAPEAGRLSLGSRYLKHLEGLFRGALALARESHVKQLAVATAGCAGPRERPIYVSPDLGVEPVPKVYVRRAATYRFVRDVLDEAFGGDWRGLRRLTREGPVAQSLGEELGRMERLSRGAAAVSYRDLGLPGIPGSEEAIGEFERWRGDLQSDPDVSVDTRMMVPVFYDRERRQMKLWLVLGWESVPVRVDYERPPSAIAVEPERPPAPKTAVDERYEMFRRKIRRAEKVPPAAPRVEFRGDAYEFAVPVTAEAYVSRLLDRDEFRRHCDRHHNAAEILRHLL
jgi:hypothetical protein